MLYLIVYKSLLIQIGASATMDTLPCSLIRSFVWVVMIISLIYTVDVQAVNSTTASPSTLRPDPRCTPSSLRVRISDDEEPGCQHKYALNIPCLNWGYRERLTFTIASWRFDKYVKLVERYAYEPAVCVYGLRGQLKDQFNDYTTILNVTRGQGELIYTIPLTFEIVEVNDPPRITYPADIYVLETEAQRQTWNITYYDPDDIKRFPSVYTITSLDIPEQLIIQTNSVNQTGTTVQQFTLVLVKPFDADIYSTEQLEPQRYESYERHIKRSNGGNARYSRRSKEPYFYKRTNMNKRFSSGQRVGLLTRIKRQGRGEEPYHGLMINFTLTIADQAGLWTEFMVNVHIGDFNDNAPVCTTPETVAISREGGQQDSLFELRTICSDMDYSYNNRITDYRLSNMKGCFGVFGINNYGSLYAKVPLPENMTICEFDAVAMDRTYATSVHLRLVFGECEPNIDARGVLWNASQPGSWNYMSCPKDYTGSVSRFCNNYATYDPAVYACTSQTIRNISRKVDQIYYAVSTNRSLSDALYELKQATVDPLMAGDVETVLYTMRTAANIVKRRAIDDTNKTEAFLDVANNILSESNSESWTSIIYKSGVGAEKLTQTIDEYVKGVVLADQASFTKPENYIMENLMMATGRLANCSTDMQFPNRSSTLPDWMKQSANKFHLHCSSAGKNTFFLSTFYRNITNLIPLRTFNKSLMNDMVNSAVMSLSLFPEQTGSKNLDPPVEVTFDVINKTQKDPKCSYWKTGASGGQGYWATDGCSLKNYQNGIVTCLCNHLTNFAVLMSPSHPDEIPTEHTEALGIISLIGCIISMICLLLTIVVYIIYWKAVKSERAIMLLNLCVTLFLAYLIFLAGVNKTANQAGCTVVAVLLHYIYLEVFMLMLVQGINLALTVLKPLRKQRFGWQMILASYGLCLIIVAISMGVTQLNGYGNKRFCWLTVESGLLWAFLAPVLFVVIANTVIVAIVLRGMFGTAAVKKKTKKEKIRTGVRSLLILMPVMGLTWLFGIFAVNRETVVFQYLFAVFNSIQGLLIFIFHCVLNKKIQDAFKKTRVQLFGLESGVSEGERMPMKSAETADTDVK